MVNDDKESVLGWVIGGGIVAALLALFLVWATMFITVDNGHIGVMSNFGSVSNKTLDPGWHLVMPWRSIHKMNVQTQKDEEPASVPTKNGLPVEMKATLLFRLDSTKAVDMVKQVGKDDYMARVVTPYFKSALRDVCAKYDPEALYSGERSKVESELFEKISKELEKRGIIVEAVMILDPVLPQSVQVKIAEKASAEQDAKRMEFVLKQKELEARAKVIEAEGVAKAQAIIKQDLDDNYLKYLWIMALKEHSGAIIYVPTGQDGMPFFHPVHPSEKK